MSKIAVLFPGIGYTCDKPLLYYSGKLARAAGYEVRPVPYGGFPSGVKGNREKMEQAFLLALQQTEQILSDVNWEEQEEILFLSKSVGTVVSGAYAEKHALKVRSILYTPLADTFRFSYPDAIAFHGTSDPWAKTEEIGEACRSAGIPLYLTADANHSLETGVVETDLKELERIMEISGRYIRKLLPSEG